MITVAVYAVGNDFERMANALTRSIDANSPARVLRLEKPADAALPHTAVAQNSRKLLRWVEVAEQVDMPLVLMDADTLVLGDLRGAFETPFDVGVTLRPGRLLRNAGVVYVRPSDSSRSFLRAWLRANDALAASSPVHVRHAMHRYGGVNQASLARVLGDTTMRQTASIADLPCSRWNSCDETWREFSAETVVVHFKGALRRALRSGRARQQHIAALVARWRDYDLPFAAHMVESDPCSSLHDARN